MIALDSSALICLIQRIEPARGEIAEIMAREPGPFILSAMAVTECLSGPLRRGDSTLADEFRAFFASRDCHVVPLDLDIAVAAARWRADHRLKAPDAIHLATALAVGATHFVSTDERDYARLSQHVPLALMLLPRQPDQRPQ